MAIIYKIFRTDEFAAFMADGRTLGAPIDVQDGYVHLSTKDQVIETVAKHFSGEDGLKLLGIESDALGDDLRWEVSRGDALFPHLFRELRTSDVSFSHDLPLVDGTHQFEGLLR